MKVFTFYIHPLSFTWASSHVLLFSQSVGFFNQAVSLQLTLEEFKKFTRNRLTTETSIEKNKRSFTGSYGVLCDNIVALCRKALKKSTAIYLIEKVDFDEQQ